MEKKCFVCEQIKPIADFYKHNAMSDGHLNKCKDCTKTQTKDRILIMQKDLLWVEKERERSREKYHRLYKNSVRFDYETRKPIIERYKIKYPEKNHAKNLSSHLKPPHNSIGLEKHHWSYKKEHAKDVIWLSKKDHSTAHRFLVYEKQEMQYKTLDGVLLDTKDKHINYLKQFLK